MEFLDEFLHAIEYPAIAGKTVKSAKSWIEDGRAVFELTFTDETSFTFQCLPEAKTSARSFDPEGEVVETWEYFCPKHPPLLGEHSCPSLQLAAVDRLRIHEIRERISFVDWSNARSVLQFGAPREKDFLLSRDIDVEGSTCGRLVDAV